MLDLDDSTRKTEKPITISSTSRSSAAQACSACVENLDQSELDAVEGALEIGSQWVRRNPETGRLMTRPAFEKLPDPVRDEKMHPHWRPPLEAEDLGRDLFDLGPDTPLDHSPSIYISSLCGYGYSPDMYKQVAETLESFGFACMRSARGTSGKYWEVWYLPGLFAAEGGLKDFLEHKGISRRSSVTEIQSREVLRFLTRRAPAGSYDVSVQRMAMTID